MAAIATVIGVLPFGPAVQGVAAATGLSFLEPTGSHLAGTTDLAVDAPVESVTETAGRIGTRVSVPLDQKSAHLRILRRGTKVAGEYSTDGHDWYPVADATLGGKARVALQALGDDASPPVVSNYVDDLTVLTSGDLSVTSVTVANQPLFVGAAVQADVTVTNGSDHPAGVDTTLDVPDGWSAGTTSATVPAFGQATVHVPVTPDDTPRAGTIRARVTGQNGAVVHGSAGTQVLSAPRGDRVPLAVDAGTATSRLLSTYRRLSPSDGWDARTGYGWVGSGPQSRDRGGPDDLRRDIVTDTARRTLRVAVPAGVHDVYLLVGDHGFATDAMAVSRDGRTLTHLATPLPADEFTWLKFSVDGGQSGQDVDLDFTADNPGQYWRLAGLIVDSGG
jgi:hypothetical protein